MSCVDCTGLDAPNVLATMYNNAKPMGYGFFHADSDPMTVSEAASLLSGEKYFDYVKGRPLKTSFAKFPLLDPWGFDRDQGGPGTLQTLVNRLKTAGADEPVVPADEPVVREGWPSAAYFEKFLRVEPWAIGGALQTMDDLETAGINEPVVLDDKSVVHNGRPLSDFKGLAKFDQVYFVDSFAEELDKKGIPYPYDWHMFVEITSDGKYRFVGSMGGGFLVGRDEPVVKSL